MENPRPEKVAIVDEVRDRIENAEAVMITEYRGLTVSALSELRTNLRPVGGRYKIYKNTLVRRAANDVADGFTDLLTGPTALAFTEQTPEGEAGDVVAVAKVLKDFGKANPELIIKGGVFEGNFIDAAELSQLAEIEPREVLLAKLAGAIAAPMSSLAGLLQALPRDFAYGLKALIDEGGAADAPAADASASKTDDASAEGSSDSTESDSTDSDITDSDSTDSDSTEPTVETDAAEGEAPAQESEA